MKTHRSEITQILMEINELSRCCVGFKVCFSPRSCNKVAHLCIKQVSPSMIWSEWIDIAPHPIRECLIDDCYSAI
jgi:hypothetical protein